jgi:hypothetical protein
MYESLWIRLELGEATAAAEVVGLAGVLGGKLRGGGIHRHPAHGIDGAGRLNHGQQLGGGHHS